MIEITQVNASLDEADDENACLIVGKRVAKRVLRCKDSEIKSIELHRKSIDARKKRDVHFILSFRVELTSPHLEREAVDSVAERDRSRVRAIEDDEPSFPSPASDAPQERPVVVGAGCAGLFAALTLAEAGLKLAHRARRPGISPLAGDRPLSKGAHPRPREQYPVWPGRRGNLLGRQTQYGNQKSRPSPYPRNLRRGGRAPRYSMGCQAAHWLRHPSHGCHRYIPAHRAARRCRPLSNEARRHSHRRVWRHHRY